MKILTKAGVPQKVKYRKKPRQSAKVPDPVILLTPAGCIKLAAQSETHYYGYNLLTEKLEGCLKTDCANVTKFIAPILKDKFLRAQIALVLSGNHKGKASKMLGLGERSVYRHRKNALSSFVSNQDRVQK